MDTANIEQYLKSLQLHIEKNNESLVHASRYLDEVNKNKDNFNSRLDKIAQHTRLHNLPVSDYSKNENESDLVANEAWVKFTKTVVCSPERSDPVGLAISHISLLERSETTRQSMNEIDSLIEYMARAVESMETFNDKFELLLTKLPVRRESTSDNFSQLTKTSEYLTNKNKNLWTQLLNIVKVNVPHKMQDTQNVETLLRRLVQNDPHLTRNEFLESEGTSLVFRYLLRNQWITLDAHDGVQLQPLEESLLSLQDI